VRVAVVPVYGVRSGLAYEWFVAPVAHRLVIALAAFHVLDLTDRPADAVGGAGRQVDVDAGGPGLVGEGVHAAPAVDRAGDPAGGGEVERVREPIAGQVLHAQEALAVEVSLVLAQEGGEGVVGDGED